MPSPKKNTAYVFDVQLINSTSRPDFKANPTLAAGDVKVSTDEGTFSNITTLPTVTPASGTNVKVSLSSTEMNGDRVVIQFVDQTSPKEWDDVIVSISTSASTIEDAQADLDIITGTNGVLIDDTEAGGLVDDFFDEALSGHNVSGSLGKAIRQMYEGIISIEGSINDVSATTTTFITDLAETSDSHYSDLTLVFIGGNLVGQAKPILSYNGTTKTIVLDEALSEAPANGDAFIILTTHVHPTSQIAESVRTEIDSNSTKLASIETDTQDIQSKIGTPSGVSVSADIAAVKSDTAAILIDTNELQTDLTDGGRLDLIIDAINGAVTSTGVLLTIAERNAVADALLDRDMSTGTDSGSATVRTARQALRSLRNKVSISGGTLTVTKEDDSTASWTAAVTTAAGDPINSIDPADV